jgi:hypothetical protein
MYHYSIIRQNEDGEWVLLAGKFWSRDSAQGAVDEMKSKTGRSYSILKVVEEEV